MSLKDYKSKRNLSITPEPKPLSKAKKKSSPEKSIFVVQEHHASHLHWDFRLECKGVLLSWAIPKGPSLDPQDKRLAIHVEDHPLEYASFKGEIPKGQYGAGTVSTWDKGTYSALGAETKNDTEKNVIEGLQKGHISITLHGKRLKGDFDLIHLKNPEKDNLWILVKKKDQYASQH